VRSSSWTSRPHVQATMLARLFPMFSMMSTRPVGNRCVYVGSQHPERGPAFPRDLDARLDADLCCKLVLVSPAPRILDGPEEDRRQLYHDAPAVVAVMTRLPLTNRVLCRREYRALIAQPSRHMWTHFGRIDRRAVRAPNSSTKSDPTGRTLDPSVPVRVARPPCRRP